MPLPTLNGYFTVEMLTSGRLPVVNGIEPDVDSPHALTIYRKRERNWLASLNGDKGVKAADFEGQKTLDVYFYPKGGKTNKTVKIEVER